MITTLADAWLHTLSPYVLRLGETFGIRWYGLSYVAAFAIGWWILSRLAARGTVRIPRERVGDAILIVAIGVIVGGRLGYVLFYRQSLLWTFFASPPWWGVVDITEGGMSAHGGMIGVCIAAWFISRGWKTESGTRIGVCPPLHVMDALVLLAPVGMLLGRIANFVNGELLGRIVAAPGERGPWWSVRFPQELGGDHAPELNAAQRADLAALLHDVSLPDDSYQRMVGRVMDRVWAGDADVIARVEPLVAARYPSQLIQAAAEGIVVGLIVWLVARKPRVPGIVGAWFLISYGVLRISTEFVRLPDAHLAVKRPLGLSLGQWYSLAMVAIGAIAIAMIVRRGGERMGGWGRRSNEPIQPSEPA